MPAPILTAPKLQATSRQTRFNPSIEVKKELDLHDVNLAIISSASSSASSSSGAATNGSSHQRERRSGATPSGSGSSTPTASAAAAATVNSHHLVQKDILRDVHLQLNPGVRYVLHGLNGVGKSTLLKAIGERHIPGIPWGLRIRLLQQQQEEEQGQEEATEQWKVQGDRNVQQSAPSASGYSQHTPSTGEQGNPGDNAATTVLEYVVRSDKERQEAMERSEALSAAIDDTSDPSAALRVVRELQHQDTLRRLEVAQKEADLRSGARGMAARKHLKVMEKELEESLSRLSISEDDDPLDGMNQAVTMLSDLQMKLDLMSAETAQARAVSILTGLGFSQERMLQTVDTLSGGWRMRCQLASVLFQPCDLLLLDEPTNFLDFTSLLWLEDYLSTTFAEENEDAILLMVSHDRAFVDKIAEQVIVLRDHALEYFPGTLSEYYRTRAEKKRSLIKLKEAQDRQKAHMEKTIAGNLRAARQSGDDKKLKQAASRQKRLDDRMGISTNARGGKFKVSRDRPGYHNTARDEIVIPQDDVASKFRIRQVAEGTRFVGPLLSCEDLAFTYRGNSAPTIQGVNLSLRLGDKVAFVGENGAGKSTLISCLVHGHDDALAAAAGAATVAATDSSRATNITKKGKITGTLNKQSGASVGYFSQNVVDELSSTEYSSMTALQYIHLSTEQETRAALASLGLVGKTVSDLPISALSGGQKVRVALCRILYPSSVTATGAPPILILDEITTHLDADTVQALAKQLRRYRGALVIVSHDRWFVQAVVEGRRSSGGGAGDGKDGGGEEESSSGDSDEYDDDGDGPRGAGSGLRSPGTVYWVNKGKVRKLNGGVEEFEEKIRRRAAKQSKAAGVAASNGR